jgi:hypothetical protein
MRSADNCTAHCLGLLSILPPQCTTLPAAVMPAALQEQLLHTLGTRHVKHGSFVSGGLRCDICTNCKTSVDS